MRATVGAEAGGARAAWRVVAERCGGVAERECGPWLPDTCRELVPTVGWSPTGHPAVTDGSKEVRFAAAASECGRQRRAYGTPAQSLPGRAAGERSPAAPLSPPPSAPGTARSRSRRSAPPPRRLPCAGGRPLPPGGAGHPGRGAPTRRRPASPSRRGPHHQHDLSTRRRARISRGQLRRGAPHHLLVHLRQLPADRHRPLRVRGRPAAPASRAPAAATRRPRSFPPRTRTARAARPSCAAGSPTKRHSAEGNPDATSAVIAADGPGRTSTGSPAATRREPARSPGPTRAASRRRTRGRQRRPRACERPARADRACSLCSW